MNYQLHYEKLISKARNRSILKSEYSEVHHIIPKSLGGDNSKDNLIELFPEEHLVAHLLLSKIYSDNKKMLHAVFRMSQYRRYTNKTYAWLKNKYSKLLEVDNPMFKDEVRKKMSLNRKGKLMGNDNPSKRKDVKEKLSSSILKSWENDIERKKEFSNKFLGSKNPSAKIYLVTDDKNNQYLIHGGLKKFAVEKNISLNILRNWVGKGKIGPTTLKDNSFIIFDTKRKLRDWKIDEMIRIQI